MRSCEKVAEKVAVRRPVDANTRIETLDERECLRLLATEEVGRIAVVLDNQPLVFPVNYVLDGHAVVFRTDPGTKLVASSLEKVAFEVDHIDATTRTAWSVVVQGVGQEITAAYHDLFDHIRSLPVLPLAPGPKERWVRVNPLHFTGRRILVDTHRDG
jgi:nitroimidazol reductase NimA-like FMN-containing flavoprotein (pyridoxamine 5'-phosphate oxidase superfamily)